MKILFVTRKYPPSKGGMETYSYGLFQALSAIASGTTLLQPQPAIVGKPTTWQLLRFFLRAIKAIWSQRRKYDAILLGDVVLAPLAWLARAISGRRIIIAVAAHGNDVYFAERPALKSRLYRWLVQRSISSIDTLIANSSDTEQVAKRLGFQHTTRIPLGTHMPEVPPALHELPTPHILFAGRLIHYKGLSWFVKEVLPLVHEDLRLLVAGPEWDPEEWSAIDGHPRVEYLGTLDRPELDKLRARVMASVMPNLPPSMTSQNEGFGLSALESPAVGTPVVVSGVGGLSEAVVHGTTGFIVQPLDALAFAERLNTIRGWSDEMRSSFAGIARQEIRKSFSWDRVAQDYVQHIQSVSQAPPHPAPRHGRRSNAD